MVRYKILQPSLIRFTATKIPSKFDNGVECSGTVEMIMKGKLDPDSIDAIRVFNLKGIYYTPDNRRLYVFRAAQYMGLLDYISVIVVSPCDFDLTVINPECGGKTVNFDDGAEIYPHWKESWTFSHAISRETLPKSALTSSRYGNRENTSIQHSEHYFEKDSSALSEKEASRERLLNSSDKASPGCCEKFFCCLCRMYSEAENHT